MLGGVAAHVFGEELLYLIMSDMEPIAGEEREEKKEKKEFVPQDPSYEHFQIRITPERRKMVHLY